MMLEHLGEHAIAARIRTALARTLAEGRINTPDLGGRSTTTEMAAAIVGNLNG